MTTFRDENLLLLIYTGWFWGEVVSNASWSLNVDFNHPPSPHIGMD